MRKTNSLAIIFATVVFAFVVHGQETQTPKKSPQTAKPKPASDTQTRSRRTSEPAPAETSTTPAVRETQAAPASATEKPAEPKPTASPASAGEVPGDPTKATPAKTPATTDPAKAKAQHLSQGESYLKESKFQEASVEFRKAIEIDENLAPAHWGLAQAYEGLQRFTEMMEELRKTTELDPGQLEVRIKLGNLYLAGSNGKRNHQGG